MLIDLPFDVQMAEIEFDIDAYEPLPLPNLPNRARLKSLAMLNDAERPLLVAGGGIFNADAADKLVEFAERTGVPGYPNPDGLGRNPGRP